MDITIRAADLAEVSGVNEMYLWHRIAIHVRCRRMGYSQRIKYVKLKVLQENAKTIVLYQRSGYTTAMQTITE